ncbi:ABC transporter ATP-binding protein [Rhodovibrionaceae bacterium A322]
MAKNKSLTPDPTTRVLMGRLWRSYITRHRSKLVMALFCMAVVGITTGLTANYLQPVIDEIVSGSDWHQLIYLSAVVVGIFFIKGAAAFGQSVLMSFIGFRVIVDVQNDLLKKLVGADLAFYHKESPGSLIARFLNDVNLMRTAASTAIVAMGRDSVMTLALLANMLYMDWQLAALACVVFPTVIYPLIAISRRMRKISRQNQEQTGLLTTFLDEVFQGIRQVKAYSMEGYETQRGSDRFERVFQLNMRAAKVSELQRPLMETVGGIAIALVIVYGGYRIMEGGQTLGSFVSFVASLMLAYEPVKRLARLNATLQQGMAAADRVFQMIDRQDHIVSPPQARKLEISGGSVELKDVSFAYDDEAASALQNVTLSAPAGKTVALVGASGAGKSTVLNLIPRFYDVNSGEVLIDGQSVASLDLESLRGSLSLVSQEILLFDDSIRANIAYGRPDASQAEIEAAAKLAAADGFIAALPEGYDTQVGPRGSKLSGGQRQRISIARALLKDAPILLLDEATSALDTKSERQVQAALNHLMDGRTTLVIAHRLSTVVDADIIYVMENGRVVEEGNHTDLLAKEGAYARLHALQFSDDDPAGQTKAPQQLDKKEEEKEPAAL